MRPPHQRRNRTNHFGGYPFRVLNFKDGVTNTWDFRDRDEAEYIYNRQIEFDRCLLLLVSQINVKLIKEKSTKLNAL